MSALRFKKTPDYPLISRDRSSFIYIKHTASLYKRFAVGLRSVLQRIGFVGYNFVSIGGSTFEIGITVARR